MGVTLTFDFLSRRGTHRGAVDIKAAVIGGWTARNKAAMEAHMHELEIWESRARPRRRCSTASARSGSRKRP